MENRMRTRSQVPLHERNSDQKEKEERNKKKIAIHTAPYISYKGKLHYYNEFVDCAEIGEKLLNIANEAQDPFVVGFDIEWPFSFQTGSGRSAVIQISDNLEECYVIQISGFKKLPKSMTDFLTHSNVRLTGNNIKNDIRKLSRDFAGIDVEKGISNCIDLGLLANEVMSTTGRWSMERLVENFFELRINKDKSVRMSKWHQIPLSKAQQVYAAIDAYASLKLYLHLKEIEKENINSEDITLN